MSEETRLPRGDVDLRKYAAISLALGLARGALFDAMRGQIDHAQKIFDITAIARIAEALGCPESDLAIDWNEHLTPDEKNRIKGW
jgi:hypothetical protein